jgi:ribosomal protein S6
MKRYEGLFILNPGVQTGPNKHGKDEGLEGALEKLEKEIQAGGGKIETVQRMDKKNFSRVAHNKHTAGFYVNIIFQTPPEAIMPLRKHLALNEDLYRVLFTEAPPAKPTAVV